MLKTNYVSVTSKEDLEVIASKYALEIDTKKTLTHYILLPH